MILSHNLALSGIQVTTFSSILCELKQWFPNQVILPYPPTAKLDETFSPFTTIIAADHSLLNSSHNFDNHLLILKESSFNKSISMAENLQNVCKKQLSLPHSHIENGIVFPKHLQWRAHPERVAIHPTSYDEKKNWPEEKFLKLAKHLEEEGFSPYFCMGPEERERWKAKIDADRLPLFSTVSELASFLYECGYLIGNDSGLGHLASCLGIPTLSLFARKSYSRLWGPGWGKGLVVTPPSLLIGAKVKQKYWKKLLSVSRVLKQFAKLREER